MSPGHSKRTHEKTTVHPALPAFTCGDAVPVVQPGKGMDSTAVRPPLDMETRTASEITAAR